jgi:hypothetical protein
MSRLIAWTDRTKLVEGVIVVGALVVMTYTRGILQFLVPLAIVSGLLPAYLWWRRKGIFRNRR